MAKDKQLKGKRSRRDLLSGRQAPVRGSKERTKKARSGSATAKGKAASSAGTGQVRATAGEGSVNGRSPGPATAEPTSGGNHDGPGAAQASVEDRRESTAVEPAPTPPVRPPGQWLWEMPYSAVAPRLINPGIGLHNLVARAGHNAGYDIDLTLLDAPDHRMIRSGVLLAHRVLDGRGEWYLGAPDWVPLLPKERIEPMSHGDLPEDLADLIRPFRRRAPLGPVAALSCERREFALRDNRGNTLALVRDDKVTVRRGGLTTARYREVMLTPVGPGLSAEQDTWMATTLGSVGATPVPKFPRLATRLGAPSTGATDFPVPPPASSQGSFGSYLAAILATRLRELLAADLGVRTGDSEAAGRLAATASALRRELQGLAPLLDGDWWEDLDDDLGWLMAEAGPGQLESRRVEGAPEPDRSADSPPSSTALKTRLRGERYLTLLERLVTAARTPRAAEAARQPAGAVLAELLDQAVAELVDRADALERDAPLPAWAAAHDSARAALRVVETYGPLTDRRVDKLRARLTTTTALIAAVTEQTTLADRTASLPSDCGSAEAFELGRRYEQTRRAADSAREAFVTHWTKTARKIAV